MPTQENGGEQLLGTPSRPLVIIFAVWVRIAVVGLACAIIAGRLGGVSRTLDLAGHFQAQYLAGSLLCLGLLLLLRRWRWAGVAALCAAVTAGQVVPWYLPAQEEEMEGTSGPHQPLRVLLSNVLTGNRRHEDVIALIRDAKPDVVVLQEVNDRWMSAMEAIGDDLPHMVAAPREDNFGIAVFSRYPLQQAKVVHFGTAEVESIVGDLGIAGCSVTLIATHPVPPVSRRLARQRDEQLEAIAERIAETPGPVLLVGDLNVTMWSAPYRRLIDETGLCNARKGFGVLPSWSTRRPWFARVPIDHCLHSPEIGVQDCELGDDIGSDHLPLAVDLLLPGGP